MGRRIAWIDWVVNVVAHILIVSLYAVPTALGLLVIVCTVEYYQITRNISPLSKSMFAFFLFAATVLAFFLGHVAHTSRQSREHWWSRVKERASTKDTHD